MSTLEKLMIVGAPGVGKTTLAKILGTELDLPVLHIDDRFINFDGSYKPIEEMKKITLDICSGNKWIIDGMCRIMVESVINAFISPFKLARITKINKKAIKLIMKAVMCKNSE